MKKIVDETLMTVNLKGAVFAPGLAIGHIIFHEPRVEILKFKSKNLEIVSFNALTTSICSKYNATIIFRGLRAVSDFEYEFQMTGMNYKLNPKIETIFLMSLDKYQLISSKLIKEINALKGDVSQFVPKIVENKLIKKN